MQLFEVVGHRLGGGGLSLMSGHFVALRPAHLIKHTFIGMPTVHLWLTQHMTAKLQGHSETAVRHKTG